MIHLDVDRFCQLANAANKLNDLGTASEVLKAFEILNSDEVVTDVCACEVSEIFGNEDCIIGHDLVKLSYQIETSLNFYIECVVTICLYDKDMYTFEDVLRIKF